MYILFTKREYRGEAYSQVDNKYITKLMGLLQAS